VDGKQKNVKPTISLPLKNVTLKKNYSVKKIAHFYSW